MASHTRTGSYRHKEDYCYIQFSHEGVLWSFISLFRKWNVITAVTSLVADMTNSGWIKVCLNSRLQSFGETFFCDFCPHGLTQEAEALTLIYSCHPVARYSWLTHSCAPFFLSLFPPNNDPVLLCGPSHCVEGVHTEELDNDLGRIFSLLLTSSVILFLYTSDSPLQFRKKTPPLAHAQTFDSRWLWQSLLII